MLMIQEKKPLHKGEEFAFSALTNTEKMHIIESTRHNHDLMVRLAQL